MTEQAVRLLVFSSLFPSEVQPGAGLFIRERMFRVSQHIPVVVVAPVPWFPFQAVIRHFKPGYRLQPSKVEEQQGIRVYYPRFLALPGLFRSCDGFSMAVCSLYRLLLLKKSFGFTLIDAHFAWPDGYAATLLGRWFRLPVTITLRGSEVPQSRDATRRKKILQALHRAVRVFSVSASLKEHVIRLGANADKIQVVGNGVDSDKFTPVSDARSKLPVAIGEHEKILITVGGLVERKGFHRVIEIMPQLLKKYPNLHYLIIGGQSGEGDMSGQLRAQVAEAGLQANVHFLGPLPATELKVPLSAADLFVLPTRNEGWANVILESMACGTPVIASNVGGNNEVIANSDLGTIVPFGDASALYTAIDRGLCNQWNRKKLVDYARANAWDTRVDMLVMTFKNISVKGQLPE